MKLELPRDYVHGFPVMLPRDFREYALMPRESVAEQPPAMTSVTMEYDYTQEQFEWIMAMDALKRKLKRQPTWGEVFREAIVIGYRRVCHDE